MINTVVVPQRRDQTSRIIVSSLGAFMIESKIIKKITFHQLTRTRSLGEMFLFLFCVVCLYIQKIILHLHLNSITDCHLKKQNNKLRKHKNKAD